MSLSKHIKDLRRQENLTQRDLADRAGVGIHFVRDLEQGKSSLRMDKVNEVLKREYSTLLSSRLKILCNR